MKTDISKVMRGIPREAVARKMPVMGSVYTADQIADTTSTCSWLNLMYGVDLSKPGAQEYFNSLFELYASWGVDYVKVDDISSPYHAEEIEAFRKAIDLCGKPIVLSLSPGNETPGGQARHVMQHANLWRISSDFWDDWSQLREQFELLHKWEKYIGPGHWPDADIIPVGLLNRRGPSHGMERRSRFTDTEKFTLMTLWAIARSPLMYGGDLMMMRPVELTVLTNKEVLEINQNSSHNRQLFRRGNQVAWIAHVPNSGDKYVALFNTGDEMEETLEITLKELGLGKAAQVRDIWSKKELGIFENRIIQTLKPHEAMLLKVMNHE